MNGVTQFTHVGQIIEVLAAQNWSEHGSPFLLLDGARLPKMRTWLRSQRGAIEWVGLFGGDISSELLEASPVLVSLPSDMSDHFLYDLLNAQSHLRAASFIVSQRSLSELVEHFEQHLYVYDPDGQRWGLAFWDPFILSSLVGSSPSASALVPGPVFAPEQCASLLEPVDLWCFRARDGGPCAIQKPTTMECAKPPFLLNRAQMDQLMDLSLPDQVLNVLAKAIPQRIAACPEVERHRISCEAIRQCRKKGDNTLAAYCAIASDALPQS